MKKGLIILAVVGALGLLALIFSSILSGNKNNSEGETSTSTPANPTPSTPSDIGDGNTPVRETPTNPRGDNPVRTPSNNNNSASGGIRGRVVNGNGEVVIGARVDLDRPIAKLNPTVGTNEKFPPAQTATTDGQGRFRLERVSPYDQYILTAQHPDYAPTKLSYVEVLSGQTLEVADLVLKPGFSLRVSVVDKSNNPIPNATLRLDSSLKNPFIRTQKDQDAFIGTTDGGGTYEFRNLPKGQMAMQVSARGFGSRSVPNLSFKEESPALTQEVVLDEGKWIAGKVVDESGRPVANARVDATSYSSQNPSRGTTTSTATGQFVVEDLAEGTYVLVVTAENYALKRENRINAGESEVNVVLAALGTVTGRVSSKKNGQPIKSFTLEVRKPLPNGTLTRTGKESRNFRSDDGSFSWKGFDPNSNYVILASAPNHASNLSQVFSVTGSGTTAGIDIVLSEGASIHGFLVDPKTKNPIANATVTSHENQFLENPLAQMLGSLMPQDPSQVTARSGPDGSFRLEHVMTGTPQQLEIQAEGFTPKFMKDISPIEGGTVELGQVFLSAGASVGGVANDTLGQPIAGGQVVVRSLAPQTIYVKNARTDSQGRYSFKHLPPGDYQISITVGSGEANIFATLGQNRKFRQNISLKEGDDIQLDLTGGE